MGVQEIPRLMPTHQWVSSGPRAVLAHGWTGLGPRLWLQGPRVPELVTAGGWDCILTQLAVGSRVS